MSASSDRRFFEFVYKDELEHGRSDSEATSTASVAIAHEGYAAAYAEHLMRQLIDILVRGTHEHQPATETELKSMRKGIADGANK